MLMRIIVPVVCLSVSALRAADDDPGLHSRNAGYFGWDLGYLNEAQNGSDGAIYESVPYGNLMGGMVLEVKPNDRFTLTINPELKSYLQFPVKPGEGGGESQFKPKWLVYMEEAKAHLKLGEPGRPIWDLGAGFMIHKENPDTRIFGDYLFRSWIYPGILFTKFNYPQAQIFGLRLGHRSGGGFRQDLFLLSEIRYFPYFDMSLAYSAGYSLGKVFEIGAGVNFRSLVPMRPSLTTPKGDVGTHSNVHKSVPLQTGKPILDSTGGLVKIITIREVGADSVEVVVAYPDSAANPTETLRLKGRGGVEWFGERSIESLEDPATGNPYTALGGTLTPYSFAGTLLMARASFNALGLLEGHGLGRDALKVYLEAAVLGWKNYPGFYENRRERIPVMAGINLPTFDILDYLSLEAEYYPSKLFPSMYYRSSYNVPQPGIYKSNNKWNDAERATLDDWKWGIAARKSIKGFAVIAQAGSDHTKLTDYSGFDYDENLTRASHWYLQVRFMGGIF